MPLGTSKRLTMRLMCWPRDLRNGCLGHQARNRCRLCRGVGSIGRAALQDLRDHIQRVAYAMQQATHSVDIPTGERF
jgi:hypothetical protein